MPIGNIGEYCPFHVRDVGNDFYFNDDLLTGGDVGKIEFEIVADVTKVADRCRTAVLPVGVDTQKSEIRACCVKVVKNVDPA